LAHDAARHTITKLLRRVVVIVKFR